MGAKGSIQDRSTLQADAIDITRELMEADLLEEGGLVPNSVVLGISGKLTSGEIDKSEALAQLHGEVEFQVDQICRDFGINLLEFLYEQKLNDLDTCTEKAKSAQKKLRENQAEVTGLLKAYYRSLVFSLVERNHQQFLH